MKHRHRSTGPSPDVVEALYEREQWSCALCTVGVGPRRATDHEVHHRRPRRMGGTELEDTNDLPNLLLLCPDCHRTVERERSAAYEGGWLVHQDHDPAKVPVLIGASRWVLLTSDGRYQTVEAVNP
jgi:5-methylcytosine-specific restriction protein A